MIKLQEINLVEVIREAKKRLDVTQEQIFNIADMNHSIMSRWISGARKPGKISERKIIDAINRLEKMPKKERQLAGRSRPLPSNSGR